MKVLVFFFSCLCFQVFDLKQFWFLGDPNSTGNRSRDPPGAPQGVQGVLRDDLERPRRALGVPWERLGSVQGAPSEVLLRAQNLNEFRNTSFDRILNKLNPKIIEFRIDFRALLNEF